jgi:hypothetical protein
LTTYKRKKKWDIKSVMMGKKNLLYHILIYIVCFIKSKYTYNINILNIILYTYNYFLVFGEQ